MPQGWVQHRGDGSTIARSATDRGGPRIFPMGGYKGSGLSIVIGLLAGPPQTAQPSAATSGISPAPRGAGKGNVGQFVIAFDVSRFCFRFPAFKAEVDRHNSRPRVLAPGCPAAMRFRVPGMGRAARRARARTRRRGRLF